MKLILKIVTFCCCFNLSTNVGYTNTSTISFIYNKDIRAENNVVKGVGAGNNLVKGAGDGHNRSKDIRYW